MLLLLILKKTCVLLKYKTLIDIWAVKIKLMRALVISLLVYFTRICNCLYVFHSVTFNSVTIIINHRCLFLFSICTLGSNKKKLNLSWNVYSYLSAYIFNSLKIIIHHLVIFAMKRVTFCLCLPSSYL